MKTSSILSLLALAISSVSAQSACDALASKVPSCGTSCIASAASAVGCIPGDLNCRCSKSAAIASTAFNCVLGGCGIVTGLQVQASASAVCSCVSAAAPTVSSTVTIVPRYDARPGARPKF